MTNPARLLVPLVGLVVGCGGDGGGGSGGSVFTIELLEAGERTISGEVSMPENTPSGHPIQFLVAVQGAAPYAVIEGVGNTDGADLFGFRVVGANDGTFQVRAVVDINDSGNLDAGDLMGWYAGTVSTPIQVSGSAAVITVSGTSIGSADFGIGPMP